jgi:hypothetical protein
MVLGSGPLRPLPRGRFPGESGRPGNRSRKAVSARPAQRSLTEGGMSGPIAGDPPPFDEITPPGTHAHVGPPSDPAGRRPRRAETDSPGGRVLRAPRPELELLRTQPADDPPDGNWVRFAPVAPKVLRAPAVARLGAIGFVLIPSRGGVGIRQGPPRAGMDSCFPEASPVSGGMRPVGVEPVLGATYPGRRAVSRGECPGSIEPRLGSSFPGPRLVSPGKWRGRGRHSTGRFPRESDAGRSSFPGKMPIPPRVRTLRETARVSRGKRRGGNPR